MPVRFQRNIALLGLLLFAIKLFAWFWTGSLSILTDAIESIVNVIAGFLGWYSVWLAARPRDLNHPYGHGKIEFLSAAIEGILILIAGMIVVYQSIRSFFDPRPLEELDIGMGLILLTAIANFIAGMIAVRKGKKWRSLVVESSGRHLISDTYSSVGIVLGLILLRITGWQWLDALVALLFAIIIITTGYRVLRKSIAGIMDEADTKLLKELIDYIEENKKTDWIDLHNLRVIQYGSVIHIDAHLTLPYYFSVRQAHESLEELEKMVKEKFGDAVELFIHVDGCEFFSCKICSKIDCEMRKEATIQTIRWTLENVVKNKKHGILSGKTLLEFKD